MVRSDPPVVGWLQVAAARKASSHDTPSLPLPLPAGAERIQGAFPLKVRLHGHFNPILTPVQRHFSPSLTPDSTPCRSGVPRLDTPSWWKKRDGSMRHRVGLH